MVAMMSVIGMPLRSHGQVRTLRKRHRANSFLWAHVPKEKLASTIILTTKIRNTIVPQLLRSQVNLKLIMMKKNPPFPQRNPKTLMLLPQLKRKGKDEEKEKGKAREEKERVRRVRAIDNLRSVQLPLSRPRYKYMVLQDQKGMFTFLRTPMD